MNHINRIVSSEPNHGLAQESWVVNHINRIVSALSLSILEGLICKRII
mgnify:CR=1 FL=1